jgi:hypothetical protein
MRAMKESVHLGPQLQSHHSITSCKLMGVSKRGQRGGHGGPSKNPEIGNL